MQCKTHRLPPLDGGEVAKRTNGREPGGWGVDHRVAALPLWIPACAGKELRGEGFGIPLLFPRLDLGSIDRRTRALLLWIPACAGKELRGVASQRAARSASLVVSAHLSLLLPLRHSRESGDPGMAQRGVSGLWVPACAGMTRGECYQISLFPGAGRDPEPLNAALGDLWIPTFVGKEKRGMSGKRRWGLLGRQHTEIYPPPPPVPLNSPGAL